jgi:Protein of unknown function (DUF3137)
VTLESNGNLLIGAFAAVAGVAAIVAWYVRRQWERQRQAALARYAASRGWSFVAENDVWAGIAGGEPFGEGHDQDAWYVMRGHYGGLPSVVFDYRWVTGSGRDRTSHRAGAYAIGLPVALPWVHIRAERFMDMAARLVGGQDIELESEEFNRAFRVRAADVRLAYDLLNARTMEALLDAQALTVQIGNRYLVATLDGGLDLEWVDYTLSLLAGMVERLPDFVWTDRGKAPPQVKWRSA